MSHPFFFLCPNCLAEKLISKSGCAACDTAVKIEKDSITWNGKQLNIAQYYQFLLQKLPVTQGNSDLAERVSTLNLSDYSGLMRISKNAVLRQGNSLIHFKGYHGLFSRKIEKPAKLGSGRLLILKDRAVFETPFKEFFWPPGAFTCVTTNGHYFEFKLKDQPFFQIHFLEECALKYEIIIRKWLDAYYQPKRIVEYQPRLRFTIPQKSEVEWRMPAAEKSEKPFFAEKWIMGGISKLLKCFLRLLVSVEIHGRENWRREGKGIVLLNHQSVLDPFIFSAFLDHRVAFLTKSTSFTHWLPRVFLRWAMGLPTTRYQTDPQIIPVMKAFLKRGIKVGVFPEGERCWDGEMQSFKLSLVKILMASREALSIVILENTFRFWPRWSKFPRRAGVKIKIQAPFCLIPNLYSVEEQRRFLENFYLAALNKA